MKLCPYWARFFQRPDGDWISYCSKKACDELDKERPGWRERGEWERENACQLGWTVRDAEITPHVLTKGMRANNLNVSIRVRRDKLLRLAGIAATFPVLIDAAQWDRIVAAFIEEGEQ